MIIILYQIHNKIAIYKMNSFRMRRTYLWIQFLFCKLITYVWNIEKFYCYMCYNRIICLTFVDRRRPTSFEDILFDILNGSFFINNYIYTTWSNFIHTYIPLQTVAWISQIKGCGNINYVLSWLVYGEAIAALFPI